MKFDFNLNITSQSCMCTRFDRFNVFVPLWLKNAVSYKIDVLIFLDKYEFNNELINYVNEFKNSHPEIYLEIVDVSNVGDIHKISNVKFFTSLFQRLYNHGYKNIVYTDPDELLITENLDWFFSCEMDYCFSQGFEIVQNLEKNEKDYDSSLKFLDQRNYGVWANVGLNKENSSYCKLTIFKNGNTPKTQGRHATEYGSFTSSWKKIEKPFELYTIHLREMDVKTMVENYKKSIELYSYCRDALTFENEESAKTRINRWFTPNIIEIPSDIKNIIIKQNL
jgi:hypothetical protein